MERECRPEGLGLRRVSTLGRAVRPWMRQSSAGASPARPNPQTAQAVPRRGGAGHLILVVVRDIAAVHDVLPSHYVFDEEDGTGQESQRHKKNHRDDQRIVDTGIHRWAPSAPGLFISPSPSAHLQLSRPDFSQNYLHLSGT
jgi:hypothetical protein